MSIPFNGRVSLSPSQSPQKRACYKKTAVCVQTSTIKDEAKVVWLTSAANACADQQLVQGICHEHSMLGIDGLRERCAHPARKEHARHKLMQHAFDG